MSVGLVAWAATTGSLVGFGLRHGGGVSAFARYGSAILARVGPFPPPRPVAAIVGLVAHSLWMAVWGTGFAFVAARLRFLPASAVALVLALALSVLSGSWAPSVLGAVRYAAPMPTQVIALAAVMAAGLAGGLEMARRH